MDSEIPGIMTDRMIDNSKIYYIAKYTYMKIHIL